MLFEPLTLSEKTQERKRFFFKIFFFKRWTIFKVFTEFVTAWLLSYVLVSGVMRHVGS